MNDKFYLLNFFSNSSREEKFFNFFQIELNDEIHIIFNDEMNFEKKKFLFCFEIKIRIIRFCRSFVCLLYF